MRNFYLYFAIKKPLVKSNTMKEVMRKSGFLALALALIFVTACKPKVDEQTKKDAAGFEAKWKATGDKATAWITMAGAGIDSMKNAQMDMMKDSAKMMDMTAKMKDAKKKSMMMMKGDSTKKACMGMMAMGDDAKTAMATFKTNWDNDSKTWGDWKAKLDAGTLSPEDAKSGLTMFNAKLDSDNNVLMKWNDMYTKMKSDCAAACAMGKNMMPMGDMKDAKMDKKGKMKM